MTTLPAPNAGHSETVTPKYSWSLSVNNRHMEIPTLMKRKEKQHWAAPNNGTHPSPSEGSFQGSPLRPHYTTPKSHGFQAKAEPS